MKLDIHTHILPNKLPNLKERYGCPGWINIRQSEDDPNTANMYKDDVFFRKIEKNCWCLNERCNDMKRTNVTTQVLSTVPVMFSYWAKPENTLDLCHLLNDDLALSIQNNQNEACESFSSSETLNLKRFYGFGTVPMQDPQLAIEEMTRCVQDLGFKGIQIGSHINDWNLDEKKLYPIWKVYICFFFKFLY
jgi:aminocarboxymuconate-semialdehyde decarboxylase